MMAVRFSALRTGHLYPPRKYFGYSFLLESESTPGLLYNVMFKSGGGENSPYVLSYKLFDLPVISSVERLTPRCRVPPEKLIVTELLNNSMHVLNTNVHDRSKLLVTLDGQAKYFSHFLLQVLRMLKYE